MTDTTTTAGAAEVDAHASTEEAHVAGTEVAHETSSGLPQFDSSNYANQAFWLLLSLVLIYFILSRIALPRIGGILENRTKTIDADLKAASDMRNKALQAEEDYKQKLANARAEAGQIVEANKLEAQTDLNKAIAIADADIAKQSEKSVKKIAEMQLEAEKSIAEIAKDVSGAVVDAVSPASNDQGLIGKVLDKVLKG